MLQSFIVYGFLGFSMWWFGTIAARRERINLRAGRKTPFLTWEIIIPLLFFAFISGVRWKVGTDHQSYLEGYRVLLNGFEPKREIEGLFLYISKVFANLNIHFSIWFGFWAFVQIIFLYLAFKNERYLLPFIGIVIVLGGYYLGWMNGIRQTIAACMFVFSIQFINSRKPLHYFLTIFIATLFHRSAALLFIFYFIPQRDYLKNRYINLLLLLCAIIIGSNPFWIGIMDNTEGLLQFIGYERYADKLDYYMFEKQREMNLGPRRISRILLGALIIWYHPHLKKLYANTNYQAYFNLGLVGILFHNLFANTATVFLRPIGYFTIFLIPTTAYLLYYLKHSKIRGINLVYIFVFLLAISYIFFAIIADSRLGDTDWTNYKFYWDYT